MSTNKKTSLDKKAADNGSADELSDAEIDESGNLCMV